MPTAISDYDPITDRTVFQTGASTFFVGRARLDATARTCSFDGALPEFADTADFCIHWAAVYNVLRGRINRNRRTPRRVFE